MAEDLPGPPGSNRDDRPGPRPTEPVGGPVGPPEPPPSGQPGDSQQPPLLGSGPPPEPQPYSQQYGYGQPSWPTPAAGPQTEGMAVAALVVAIVGFFVCAPVGAIVALVLANSWH